MIQKHKAHIKCKTYVSCHCSAHTEQLCRQKGWIRVFFFKEDTRSNTSSCTLQSLLKFPNLSTTFSTHSDSVPWRGMYRHPLYEPSFCVKSTSAFQFGSHSKSCGLPTMMSSERALVTATLNLCTESKIQCRSEATGCAHSSLPVPIHKASSLVYNFCDIHHRSCPLPGTVSGLLVIKHVLTLIHVIFF